MDPAADADAQAEAEAGADVDDYDKIIICGTALEDNEFLKNLNKFSWLKNTDKEVLGICSGMQIIALMFGAKLTKQREIGMAKIKCKKNNKKRYFSSM